MKIGESPVKAPIIKLQNNPIFQTLKSNFTMKGAVNISILSFFSEDCVNFHQKSASTFLNIDHDFDIICFLKMLRTNYGAKCGS